MQDADILAIQETHSTEGSVAIARMPQDTCAWWSHESQSTGRVGIMVNRSFMERFPGTNQDSWQEVVPGRAAILRLDGPSGSLDVAVLYMHTGATGEARQQRDKVKVALLKALRPQLKVLTVIVGDWNFTKEDTDRVNLEVGHWSKSKDSAEHADWEDEVFAPTAFRKRGRGT